MSEAAAETATTETTEQTTETSETETPDFSALADLDLTPEQIKTKLEHARKWEQRAKENKEAADELARLQRESLPEQERLIEEARAAARAEALAEVGTTRVDDAVKLAAAGRNVDVDALLEGLDRTRFLGEDGQPDNPAISAWVDRLAPAADPNAPSVVDLGQGTRSDASLALGSDPLLAHLTAMVGPPRG